MSSLAIRKKDVRIVPSKLTPAKRSKSKKRKPIKVKTLNELPPVPETECGGCVVGHDGLKYCWDGQWVTLDDFPKTGGPWIPAFQPNGQVVWINGGNL